jgi:acetaldehyde dehydrogenase (acetylating)
MADTPLPSRSDRDLASMQEARTLARQARAAQRDLAEFPQERVDAIVDAMAAAVTPEAAALAAMAVEETGFGVVADKIQKNLFASQRVFEFIRPMRTVGVIRRIDDRRIVEIAEPFGVVAAIVPSTNPTSTAIYKILIALKARCAIVLSPHPSAARCISRVAEIMAAAAIKAGAPSHAIQWMHTVTLEGTQELMRQREVAVILATGGLGLVRAAYSAGKPAYGVGPGNAPAYIDRSADVAKAVSDIMTGKTFDNGVLCSSENSVVVDAPVADRARQAFLAQGAHFLSDGEAVALAGVLVTPQRLPNPALVGRPAIEVAARAGIPVAPDTRVLIAELAGVGRDYPLSIEKLCPVLSYYVVADWREGCERCKQILGYGGMGHTMAVHATDEEVILQFGLHKPASRIVVNTPTTHGSIGLTTGLDPAMTLGCGGFGGNITSDNISPLHLINIKRLAYETRPAKPATPSAPALSATADATTRAAAGAGLAAASLTARIDAFLAARGYAPHDAGTEAAMPAARASTPPSSTVESLTAAEFVCEDDVRNAVREGRRIGVGARTIVTPAARDLGEASRVLVDVS